MDDINYNDETINTDPKLIHFLRFFQLQRMVTEKEMIEMYRLIFNNSELDEMHEVIDTINSMIEKSKLEIKILQSEFTSKMHYVFISTTNKSLLQWPSNYTDHELEVIKNIFEKIIVSSDGSVTTTNCLNLVSKLSKTEIQNLIKNLIDDKWLIQPTEGKISLSPLSLCEFDDYFKTYYKDVIPKCIFCLKNVFYGEVCSSCYARGHTYCISKYKNSLKQGSKMKCLKCNTIWFHNKPDTSIRINENMEVD